MMYRRDYALAAVLALGLTACGEAPADDAESAMGAAPAAEMAASADEAAVQELAEYWESHYNTQDAAMVASVHAEDGWWLPADGAYHQGREAIEAALAETTAGAPTAEIEPVETRFFGDMAVSIGRYAITVPGDGGEAMAFSGTYMNALAKEDGEWTIQGSISNYDADPPAEWDWAEPMAEVPEEAGENVELADAYEAAWNAGDVDAILDFYADEALASFSNGPIREGHDAIRADLEARMTEGAQIEIFNVGSEELGDGWMGDGGWYRITGPGGLGVIQTGWYMNLLRVAPDGTRTIHWTLTNGVPAEGM